MYTQKEINDVLKIYDRLNSLRGTVRLLGYSQKVSMPRNSRPFPSLKSDMSFGAEYKRGTDPNGYC